MICEFADGISVVNWPVHEKLRDILKHKRLEQRCTNFFVQGPQTEFSNPQDHTTVKIEIVPQFYEH